MEINAINPIKIFDSAGEQRVKYGTVVYIIDRKSNKVLLLKQTKMTRVTGNYYVGLGGKLAVGMYNQETSEINLSRKVIESYGSFGVSIDDFEKGAIREVKEESGLKVKEQDLTNIGVADIRLLNDDKDEAWNISYYFCENFCGELKDCDEGILEWIDIDTIDDVSMRPADKIMLKKAIANSKEDFFIEAVYENENGKLRYESRKKVDETRYDFICTLIPDLRDLHSFIRQKVKVDISKLEKHFYSIIDLLPAHTLCYQPGVVYDIETLHNSIIENSVSKSV